jgi:glycosyltransferase involved in cell wall biosynthesis
MKKILIFINDCLSDIVRKGELTDRYYNPGDLFDEVHICMINDDRPNPQPLKKLVGRANLFLYNLPAGKEVFFKSLGWRPIFLRYWARNAIELAKRINPTLIRCHDDQLNGYAAYRIFKELGIPYVVSMHINPDEDVRGRHDSIKNRILGKAMESVERIVLQNAVRVLPVYSPILPYLHRMGAARVEVAYNVINPIFIKKKESYELHEPVRIISVGRQLREKNPENLIRALRAFPFTRLTLVGDGDYHQHLRNVATESGVSSQVDFVPAMANDKLCSMLPEFDIFAVHTEYWEISKSVLEPLLTGLPVVVNRRIGQPVKEFEGDFMILVENSEDGYANALKKLISDDTFRADLGRRAYMHAQENWSPVKTEANYVRIYNEVLSAVTS